MIVDIPYTKRKFEEFNRLMFGGELPEIPIYLSDAKTFLGKFCFKKRKLPNGKTAYYDFSLRMNTRLDLPEQEVEDTIIHEMIHYFIAYKNLEDASAHGPKFQHIMKSINERFGRHLTISYKTTAAEREALQDKRPRYHVVAVLQLCDGRFAVKVLPAWRSDKASKIEDGPAWNAWMDRLADASGAPVRTWDDFLDAMDRRHAFFESRGCVISDYGITEVFAAPYTTAEVKAIFRKVRDGGAATPAEALKFKSAWLYEGLRADARANWTTQLHYSCLRNANTRMMRLLGPDTGFDCIGEWNVAESLARLFDRLELEDALPRTVLYSLNPKDTEMLATLMGSFQKGPDRGKIQLGAAWWFLDQKDGMKKQVEALAALGCLGNFVGMLTDSRSFLSYTRHEYFRRILCAKLGEEMARGEIPHDVPWVGGIVADISYNNASRYFFGAR